jgi:hypothetical protein
MQLTCHCSCGKTLHLLYPLFCVHFQFLSKAVDVHPIVPKCFPYFVKCSFQRNSSPLENAVIFLENTHIQGPFRRALRQILSCYKSVDLLSFFWLHHKVFGKDECTD